MKTDINISTIYSSPEHHYFTRDKFEVGDAPTYELDAVDLVSGRGIKDDRFEFSKYPLTFVSEEVMREVFGSLGLDYKPALFRRNIVISGFNLNQLIGKRFVIGEVEFEGMDHCAPCTWMNAVMTKGAYGLMRGRGGLRARVTRGGALKTGANTLVTEAFDLLSPLEALKKPRLP